MEFRRVLFRSAAVGELRNVVVNMLPVEAGRDLAAEERVQGFQAHHAGSCGIEGPSHGHSALVAVPVVRRGGAEFFPFREAVRRGELDGSREPGRGHGQNTRTALALKAYTTARESPRNVWPPISPAV